jgi:cytochrome P450
MTDRHVPQLTGAMAITALADLGLASIAAGVIARRRPVVRLLERTQADSRAVQRIHALRGHFGAGPVELSVPGRRILVILDPDDVGTVLDASPFPFDPANREKRQALQQFQPHGVLISSGQIRARRRVVNEAALNTSMEMHRLAEPFARMIAEEARDMVAAAVDRGHLSSSDFMISWWRVVRRVVLGDAGRDDQAITDDLRRLRSAGNWAFLGLRHVRRRERFFDRLYRYAEEPAPDSLLGALSEVHAKGAVDPVGQVPQWIFAFDAAGMAALRAAALLATHPDARDHCETAEPERVDVRPFLRACVLESVRLWPTTPTLLRDTAAPTVWRAGEEAFTVQPGAAVMIVVPAFHRDHDLLPFADRFEPVIWLDGRAEQYPQLAPFSTGPVACPGRNLVLFVTSTLLAHLFSTARLELRSTPRLDPAEPLPATLNQLTLDFGVSPLRATAAS